MPPAHPATAAPGQLLVRFQPGVTQTDIVNFYAANGLSEVRNLDLGPDKSLRLVAAPALSSDRAPAAKRVSGSFPSWRPGPSSETVIPTVRVDSMTARVT